MRQEIMFKILCYGYNTLKCSQKEDKILSDKSPGDIERLVEKAKKADKQAKKADRVVSDTYEKANPQRQYRETADE
jgi:hypothetical protein